MSVDHYENFPVASVLLPAHLREAVAAIYYFARTADDMADEGNRSAEERLADLERYASALQTIEAGQMPADAILARLAKAVRQYRLPIPLLHDLLDAFRQDVTVTRYPDFNTLLDYCRRSANPIGRLLLCLYKAETEQQLKWSDAICTSLQLINHWQDVGIDLAKPRLYLPIEDLHTFGLSEADVFAQPADERWKRLMTFQVTRARDLMLSGAPLARTLPGRIGLELRLMVCGGLRILEKIEAVDYDVFQHRPVLGPLDGPRILWRALFDYPPLP